MLNHHRFIQLSRYVLSSFDPNKYESLAAITWAMGCAHRSCAGIERIIRTNHEARVDFLDILDILEATPCDDEDQKRPPSEYIFPTRLVDAIYQDFPREVLDFGEDLAFAARGDLTVIGHSLIHAFGRVNFPEYLKECMTRGTKPIVAYFLTKFKFGLPFERFRIFPLVMFEKARFYKNPLKNSDNAISILTARNDKTVAYAWFIAELTGQEWIGPAYLKWCANGRYGDLLSYRYTEDAIVKMSGAAVPKWMFGMLECGLDACVSVLMKDDDFFMATGDYERASDPADPKFAVPSAPDEGYAFEVTEEEDDEEYARDQAELQKYAETEDRRIREEQKMEAASSMSLEEMRAIEGDDAEYVGPGTGFGRKCYAPTQEGAEIRRVYSDAARRLYSEIRRSGGRAIPAARVSAVTGFSAYESERIARALKPLASARDVKVFLMETL